MSPDLGEFADRADLIEALIASGPLDNQLATSSTPRPSPSICADVVKHRDPTIGDVVDQVIASLNGQTGVVLVYLRPDGSEEVGMFETSVSCLAMFQTPLPTDGGDGAAATTPPSSETLTRFAVTVNWSLICS